MKKVIFAVAVSLLAIQFAVMEFAFAGGGVRPNEFGRPGKKTPAVKKAEEKMPATTTEKQRLDRGKGLEAKPMGGKVTKHNAG